MSRDIIVDVIVGEETNALANYRERYTKGIDIVDVERYKERPSNTCSLVVINRYIETRGFIPFKTAIEAFEGKTSV